MKLQILLSGFFFEHISSGISKIEFSMIYLLETLMRMTNDLSLRNELIK